MSLRDEHASISPVKKKNQTPPKAAFSAIKQLLLLGGVSSYLAENYLPQFIHSLYFCSQVCSIFCMAAFQILEAACQVSLLVLLLRATHILRFPPFFLGWRFQIHPPHLWNALNSTTLFLTWSLKPRTEHCAPNDFYPCNGPTSHRREKIYFSFHGLDAMFRFVQPNIVFALFAAELHQCSACDPPKYVLILGAISLFGHSVPFCSKCRMGRRGS